MGMEIYGNKGHVYDEPRCPRTRCSIFYNEKDINLCPQVLQVDPKVGDGVLVVYRDDMMDEIVLMTQQLKQSEDRREYP